MLTWPGGVEVFKTYSPTGWLTGSFVNDPGGAKSVDISYDYNPMGLMTESALERDSMATYPDFKFQYTYTTPNLLQGVTVERVGGLGGIIGETAYAHYGNGWLKTKGVYPPQIVDNHLEYVYDNLGRIQDVHKAGNANRVHEHYQYDNAGHLQYFGQGWDAATSQAEKKWVYTAPTRFGEVGQRDDTAQDPGKYYDSQVWDSATSRLTEWTTFADGATTTRKFGYEGSGRLIRIDRDNGTLTELGYDVDDKLVVESRDNVAIERFNGWRKKGDAIVMQLVDGVRAVKDGTNPLEFRFALMDVDGRAPLVFDEQGEIASTEITGAYGVPLEEGLWSAGSWEVDDLHGTEVDRDNEVMHFGVRHVLWRDGMWMQPEPLLAIGALQQDSPRSNGPQYSVGNPIVRYDVGGYRDGDVAVLFTGAINSGPVASSEVGPFHDGTDTNTTQHAMAKEVDSQVEGGVKTKVIEPELFHGNQVDEAVAFVVANHSEGGKVAVSGFSAGGPAALHTAAALAENGIETDVLVTIDVVGSPTLSVPEGVNKAVNLRQTNSVPFGQSIPGSTDLQVFDSGVGHQNIDEATADFVVSVIAATMAEVE